ncbi:hypothetical protein KUCAC02_024027, partial [Chaenocephalus aceratus]
AGDEWLTEEWRKYPAAGFLSLCNAIHTVVSLTEHIKSGKTSRAKNKRTLRVIITSTSAGFTQGKIPPALIPVGGTQRLVEQGSQRSLMWLQRNGSRGHRKSCMERHQRASPRISSGG